MITAAALACVLLVFASTALATLSYYKTSPLDAAVTYDSPQSSAWYATSIYNGSATNMNGRVWAYNVITSTYVMQLPFQTFGPGQAYGSAYPSQNSVKNYCRKANGGTQAGNCSAAY
ncbi:MAG TPA: hypothetical protein VFJ28_09415 [Marmoricola sp.]|nr:hypothetical protein [Marmoricola sp.]